MPQTPKIAQLSTENRERADHGTPLFPLQCYETDFVHGPVFWHWHEDWELLLDMEGAVRVGAGAETFFLREGEAVFLDSCVVHRFSGRRPAAKSRAIVFHPRLLGGMDSVIWQKYLQPLYQKTGVVRLSPEIPWQAECIDAFRDCWDAAAEKPMGYEFLVREALSRVALRLYRECGTKTRGLSERDIRDSGRLHVMMQFMQEHYGEPLTAAAIAQSAMIGESEALRCFRHTIGTTPGQYLRDLRIQKAADLLVLTKEKVGDVGAACGFLDPAYFTRVFREVKGVTPLEYRASHTK